MWLWNTENIPFNANPCLLLEIALIFLLLCHYFTLIQNTFLFFNFCFKLSTFCCCDSTTILSIAHIPSQKKNVQNFLSVPFTWSQIKDILSIQQKKKWWSQNRKATKKKEIKIRTTRRKVSLATQAKP